MCNPGPHSFGSGDSPEIPLRGASKNIGKPHRAQEERSTVLSLKVNVQPIHTTNEKKREFKLDMHECRNLYFVYARWRCSCCYYSCCGTSHPNNNPLHKKKAHGTEKLGTAVLYTGMMLTSTPLVRSLFTLVVFYYTKTKIDYPRHTQLRFFSPERSVPLQVFTLLGGKPKTTTGPPCLPTS